MINPTQLADGLKRTLISNAQEITADQAVAIANGVLASCDRYLNEIENAQKNLQARIERLSVITLANIKPAESSSPEERCVQPVAETIDHDLKQIFEFIDSATQ